MLLILPFVLLVQAQAAPSPLDVRRMILSSPARLLEVTIEQIKGQPDRLAWAPEGDRMYLRAVKSDIWGNRREWHYEIGVADRKLRPLEQEPGWAVRYWEWKSALTAPSSPEFRIAVESRTERKTATGIVNAAGIAQTGGDPSLGAEMGPQGLAFAQHLLQDQMVTTTTLTLNGEHLGESVNMLVVPGLTFGWAPATMNAIAFSNRKGHLLILDRAGHRREVPGAADAWLPAWSPDGTELAFVQRAGRGTIRIAVVTVSEK